MSKVPFTVAARTAKLIGQENFSNVEGAIVELVKNSYDADSKYCFVSFSSNESGNQCISILDYGCGMTDEIIKRCWMRIGTNDKLENAITKGKRVKTGAKGIGRFALNRIGKKTKMLTHTGADGENGWQWIMNWAGFDDPNMTVNEITADLDTINITTIKSQVSKILAKFNTIDEDIINKVEIFSHGTLLEITDLNDQWELEDVKSLYANLKILVPPFLQNEFSIYVQTDLAEKSFGIVSNEDFDDFDYYLSTQYSKEKKSISVTIKRNELDNGLLFSSYSGVFDFSEMKKYPYKKEIFQQNTFSFEKNVLHLKGINEKLLNEIGDFGFSFYYIKNTISDIKSEGEKKKFPYNNFVTNVRKEWLKQYGGIKIYRDGFRVRPYGEKGQDWLNLGERQAKSPGGAGQRKGGFRIRPNQISGVITISRLTNPELDDKSGREGIIENDTFELFKNLIIEIISFFEEDRNVIMYNLSQLYIKNNQTEKAKQEADDVIRSGGAKNNDDYKKIEEGYKVLQSEIDDKDEEVRLLRNLASSGLIIASFGHELHTHELELGFRIDLITDLLKNLISEEEIERRCVSKYDNPYFLLDESKKTDENIQAWLDFAIKSIRKDNRKHGIIDLCDYFVGFKSLWSPMTEKSGITINFSHSENHIFIDGRQINLDTIFNNLLSNSVASIISNKDSKNDFININLKCVENQVMVEFTDSGKGLDVKYKDNPNKIFDAMESSKCDKNGNQVGTGLGLYIVKTTLQEFKDSDIQIMNMEKGFGMSITFKKRNDEQI